FAVIYRAVFEGQNRFHRCLHKLRAMLGLRPARSSLNHGNEKARFWKTTSQTQSNPVGSGLLFEPFQSGNEWPTSWPSTTKVESRQPCIWP
ncbi:MAG: hypothetical protein DME23_19705, partial [Verrucomicrobia bacterium]